jgi:hypothetical protein
VPRIVTLTTWLVEIIEKKYSRPAGAVVRGHYATLAQAIVTVGLLVRQGWPGLASELVTERQQELAENQGIRETCNRRREQDFRVDAAPLDPSDFPFVQK